MIGPKLRIGVISLTFIVLFIVIAEIGTKRSAPRQLSVPSPPPQTAPRSILLQNDSLLLNLVLPYGKMTYPMNTLLHKPWCVHLLEFLSSFQNDGSRVVYILTASDRTQLLLLLNWLATFRFTTSSSLTEVLIITGYEEFHETLLDKGFNSLFISHEDIFKPGTKLHMKGRSDTWMKRGTVARIANRLGYDVMMLDLNAEVLKDIMGLINEKHKSSDIVGSTGVTPVSLNRRWGFTLCMGAVFIRGTKRTEKFWDAFANYRKGPWQDDQSRTNFVIRLLRPQWTQDMKCMKAADGDKKMCTAEGKTKTYDIAITLLSQKIICRYHCTNRLDSVYVWHYYQELGMQKAQNSSRSWHLKSNWSEIFEKSGAKGKQLIDEMSTKSI